MLGIVLIIKRRQILTVKIGYPPMYGPCSMLFKFIRLVPEIHSVLLRMNAKGGIPCSTYPGYRTPNYLTIKKF